MKNANKHQSLSLFIILLIILTPVSLAQSAEEDIEDNAILSGWPAVREAVFDQKIGEWEVEISEDSIVYFGTDSDETESAEVLLAPQSLQTANSATINPPNIDQFSGSPIINDQYSTGLYTGSATYSIPIRVPEGINSLQPSLQLSYNHHSASGRPGIAGSGWSFTNNMIYRDTEGTLDDTSDDTFKISFNGVNDDLVYDRNADRYFTKTESFLHITKLPVQGRNARKEYWVVKQTDGMKHYFGASYDSEELSNQEDFVVKWHHERTQDTYGNEVMFYYKQNLNEERGTTYLDYVWYNGNRINFIYDFSVYNPWQVFQGGTEVIQSGLIKEIHVLSQNQLVRMYSMSYSTNHLKTKVFLDSVTEFGSDGTSSLPPIRFSYSQPRDGFSSIGYNLPSDITFVDSNDNDVGARVVDLNSDGYSDVVRSKDSNNLEYWKNSRAGWSSKQTWENVVAGGIVDENGYDDGVRFLDLNKDGKVDILKLKSGDVQTRKYYRNTGDSFVEEPVPVPKEITFVQKTELLTACEPDPCDSGYDEIGGSCTEESCTRECLATICSNSPVLEYNGESDTRWRDSENTFGKNDRLGIGPQHSNKCYEYRHKPSSYTNCYDLETKKNDDGDYHRDCDDKDIDAYSGVGFKANEDASSWLSTVSRPYGTVFSGDVQNIDWEWRYMFYDKDSSPSRDDWDGMKDLLCNDAGSVSIYCAPTPSACTAWGKESCGYGCYQQATYPAVSIGVFRGVYDDVRDAATDQWECGLIRDNDFDGSGTYQLYAYDATTDRKDKTCSESHTIIKDTGLKITDLDNDGYPDYVKSTPGSKRVWLASGDNLDYVSIYSGNDQSGTQTGTPFPLTIDEYITPSNDGYLSSITSRIGYPLGGDLKIQVFKGDDLLTEWIEPVHGHNVRTIDIPDVEVTANTEYLIRMKKITDSMIYYSCGTGFSAGRTVGICDGELHFGFEVLQTFTGRPQHEEWIPPEGAEFVDADGKSLGVTFADINGDGRQDIIKALDGVRKTWLNTGNGWKEVGFTIPIDIRTNDKDNGVTILDINSDGLADVIRNDGSTRQAWINAVDHFESSGSWLMPGESSLIKPSTKLLDSRGKGVLDVVVAYANVRKLHQNNVNVPYLLTGVTSSLGGQTTIQYGKISSIDNTGTDDISDLGFSGWVVDSVEVKNNINGPHALTTTMQFEYSGGFMDTTNEEFLGFSEVAELYSDGTRVNHKYHQDSPRKSLEFENMVLQPNNKPVIKTERVYRVEEKPLFTIVELSSQTVSTFDGHESTPKVKRIEYSYDDYSNVIELRNLGDVSIDSDDFILKTEYVYNPTVWIVDTPKRMYNLAPGSSEKIRERLLYYDGQGLNEPPLHRIITKEEVVYNAGNIVSEYSYNDKGLLVSTKDSLGRVSSYEYEGTNVYVKKATNSLGHQSQYTYDLGSGQLLSSVDANSIETHSEYDVFGRKIKEIQPGDSSSAPTTSYFYGVDGTAPNTLVVKSKERGTNYNKVVNIYDGSGQLIQMRSPFIGNQQVVINNFYDSKLRLKKMDEPVIEDSSEVYNNPSTGVLHTTYEYDSADRVQKVIFPDGASTRTEYDRWRTTSFDGQNNKNEKVFDAFGNIIEVNEFNGDNKYTTKYTYLLTGELKTIKDNQDNLWTYSYDPLGRLVAFDDPDLGYQQYTVDAAGNKIRHTDNLGNSIEYDYDDLDRLTKKTASDLVYRYSYDGNKKGTLDSVATPGITRNYEYDDKYNVIKEISIIDGNTFQTSFQYNAQNQLISKTLPTGKVISYERAPWGMIKKIDSIVEVEDFASTMVPKVKRFENGLRTSYDYDNRRRISEIKTAGLQQLRMSYDNNNNVVQLQDDVHDNNILFTYDGIDRLIKTKSSDYEIDYIYDSIGNLLKLESSLYGMVYQFGSQFAHAPIGFIDNTPGSRNVEPIEDQVIKETDAFTYTVLATGFDPEKETFTLLNAPLGMLINNNGLIKWDTDYDDSGEYPIVVEVKDHIVAKEESFTVTVENLNRVPEIEPIGSQIVKLGKKFTYEVIVSDLDGDTLTITLRDQPSGMEIVEKEITWSPSDTSDIGDHVITLIVDDGEDTIEETFTLEVVERNRAPQFGHQNTVIVDEGEVARIHVNVKDLDRDPLTITIDDSRWIKNGDTFTWLTSQGDVGEHVFDVSVSDGDDTVTTSVNVNVIEKGDNYEDSNFVEGDHMRVTDSFELFLTLPKNARPKKASFDMQQQAQDLENAQVAQTEVTILVNGREVVDYAGDIGNGVTTSNFAEFLQEEIDSCTPKADGMCYIAVTIQTNAPIMVDDLDLEYSVVEASNSPPRIISPTTLRWTVSEWPFSFSITAEDNEGDSLQYKLSSTRFCHAANGECTGLGTYAGGKDFRAKYSSMKNMLWTCDSPQPLTLHVSDGEFEVQKYIEYRICE